MRWRTGVTEQADGERRSGGSRSARTSHTARPARAGTNQRKPASGGRKRSQRYARTQRKGEQDAPAQLGLFAPRKPRGGRRPGAGRPPKGARAGAPHKARPRLAARFPVHVVLRTVEAVQSLRRRRVYHAIREATLVTAKREDFRIVHISLQRSHVHLLVEASDHRALAKGLQGFQISAAKLINAALSVGLPGARRPRRARQRAVPRRRGAVFPDRYHAEIITSPRQARHALKYVILNWRKHGEDRGKKVADWTIDWFSSAAMFPDWTEYGDAPFMWRGPPSYEPLQVRRPQTWLLREGWKRHGATISCHEVPSAGMP